MRYLAAHKWSAGSRKRVSAEAVKGRHAWQSLRRPGAAPVPNPALLPKSPPDPASPKSRRWGQPRVIRAWGQHATGREVGLGLFLPVAKARGDKNSPRLTGLDPHPRPRQGLLFRTPDPGLPNKGEKQRVKVTSARPARDSMCVCPRRTPSTSPREADAEVEVHKYGWCVGGPNSHSKDSTPGRLAAPSRPQKPGDRSHGCVLRRGRWPERGRVSLCLAFSCPRFMP